jgi:hypothetical protein
MATDDDDARKRKIKNKKEEAGLLDSM